jgi:formylglycine-generating enzyme required for sulfatase activity
MTGGLRYAVLIGSSRFDREPILFPLNFPEKDVDGMQEILAAPDLGGFEAPRIFKNAQNDAVLGGIEELLGQVTNDDLVLIYYSGHGKTDLPGRLYLTTTNTEITKLVSTSIPIDTLRVMISSSRCRKIILILDCCYSGAANQSFTSTKGSVDESLQELSRGSGVYILTASTALQTADERDGYGLLTKHIIYGIRQGDADMNGDGLVSMDDLYKYVHTKVTSEGRQNPLRLANVEGDLIIARSSRKSIREKQKQLGNMLWEIKSSLPVRIFTKAYQVVHEPRTPFSGLVDELYHQHLEVGEFIEKWLRAESIQQQLLEPSSHQSPPPPEKPTGIEDVEEEPIRISQKPQMKPKLEETSHSSLSPKSLTVPSDRESQTKRWLRSFITSARRPLLAFGAIILFIVVFLLQSRVAVNDPSGHDATQSPTPGTSQTILPVEKSLSFANASLTPAISPTAMPWPSFNSVTLDPQGNELSRFQRQAEYISEDLNGLPLEMVKIHGGEFRMGSPDNEALRDSDEGPQRVVKVPVFFMGRFEITREQWRQVARMLKLKVEIELEEDPSHFKDSWRQPVEQVSWKEAVEFCNRLEKKTGRAYRLPSEAEWEYAARAETATPFAFGSTITTQIVNYNGYYPYGLPHEGNYLGKTVEVGILGWANAFGLSDMHGNVWEWCKDEWHGNYEGAPSDGSAWITNGGQDKRVLRGGSWDSYRRNCRSALRFWYEEDKRSLNTGFRVVYAPRGQDKR